MTQLGGLSLRHLRHIFDDLAATHPIPRHTSVDTNIRLGPNGGYVANPFTASAERDFAGLNEQPVAAWRLRQFFVESVDFIRVPRVRAPS